MTRSFLLIVGLIFIAYGMACAVDPGMPARVAGLEILTGDGYAEMGGMYGGVQLGVGLFLALAAFRPLDQGAAVLLVAITMGLVALTRGASALRSDAELTVYTWGALGFETVVTIIALSLLIRRPG
ncbi:MAG: DUF4345 family protein [Pseudomonadota bacterium]